jgi:DNA-binding NtrC family response regulator
MTGAYHPDSARGAKRRIQVMSRTHADRTVKVLVVDDDPDVCEYLQEFLSKRNYEVHFSTDPERTVPMLKDGMFQIVLLDVVMPKMDGMELLQQIRKADKDICVIILSGYPNFERAVAAFRQSVFDFLTKPFETEQLEDVLRRANRRYGFTSDLNQLAMEQIATEVKRLRSERKLSLRQLASRTGISASLIYQIEHGQTAPSLSTISRLATALNAPLEGFFRGL